MNRILGIPAEQLHPGDVIVSGNHHGMKEGNVVIEPGVFTRNGPNATPHGCVEVALYGLDSENPWGLRNHTRVVPSDASFDINRPNLIIPGLEN